MYNISNEDSEFAALVRQNRAQLEANFSDIIEKVEHTLNLFTDTIDLVHKYDLEKNKTFWNTARYINIVSLD